MPAQGGPGTVGLQDLPVTAGRAGALRKIKAFLSLKDFVNCKLTGISAIDHTTASYSLLYDVEKH